MVKLKKGHYTLKTLFAVLLASMATPGFADIQVLRKPVDVGAYEMVYNNDHQSILVATTQDRNVEGGMVYELDAKTLKVIHTIKTGKKPFGAAINNKTHTAYFGGSIDGCLIAVDIDTGKVKGIVNLVPQTHSGETKGKPTEPRRQNAQARGTKPAGEMKIHDDNRPPAPRELAVDEQTNTVYVSGVNRKDSVLWVVDGDSLVVKQTLHGLGKLNTGLAIDNQNHRLYTSNGDGEFITIDSQNNSILSRTKIVTDD